MHVVALSILTFELDSALILEYDCYMESHGRDYSGQINTTVSGLTCQAWRSQFPHEHTRTNAADFPGEHAYDL